MAKDENGQPVEEFLSPAQQGYAAMHEMFTGLVAAGFTESQAIRYIAELGRGFTREGTE